MSASNRSCRTNLRRSRSSSAIFRRDSTRCKGEQTALKQRGEELNLVFTHFGSKVAAVQAQLGTDRTSLEQARTSQGEAEASVRSAEKDRADLAQKRHGLEARREALSQLQAQHANAPRAAQRLLAEESAREIQTLAAQITVKAGYESPLALLLGRCGSCVAAAG